jgi:esterase/lipase superfamily enzyme
VITDVVIMLDECVDLPFEIAPLEDLLDTLNRNPGVTEINILAHSMGNWVTLEALRSRYIRPARFIDKVKNVMLVAPDVDVDVFQMTDSRSLSTD